jgi:glycerol-3-phosphate dehydrogenase
MDMPLNPLEATAPWDVVVIGGGINGASAFTALTAAGYRTLLIDAADFAGATSQASAMLIWGGLLYLANYELGAVLSLSRSRDRLITERADRVRPNEVLYVPGSSPRRLGTVHAGLVAYWLLSGGRRAWPRRVSTFPERAWLRRPSDGLVYEEASVAVSDARFVLEIVRDGEHAGGHARNHCRLVDAGCDARAAQWRLTVDDARTGPHEVRTRAVVNAAGGWTDEVNRLAGVTSPFRHALSRGVSIVVPRDPAQTRHLVADEGRDGPMTLGPWGPVAVWGSTDTMHASMADACTPTAADVAQLVARYHAVLTRPLAATDIIAVRCGVRPLAVRRDRADTADGPSLSRHSRLHMDATRPWLSVYGGKLSGAVRLADAVTTRLGVRVAPSGQPLDAAAIAVPPTPCTATFPALETPVVAPDWAVAHEHCRTLDDYLRRRTNIAQWVPCGGFGRHGEHAAAIEALARALHAGNPAAAAADLQSYTARVARDAALLAAADTAAPALGVSA